MSDICGRGSLGSGMTANAWGRALTAQWDFDAYVRRAEARHRFDLDQKLKPLPFALRQVARARREAVEAAQGFNAAERGLNSYLRNIIGPARAAVPEMRADRIRRRDTLTEYSSDNSVRHWARRRAAECQAAVLRAGDGYAVACGYCEAWGIAPVLPFISPETGLRDDTAPALARMISGRWWTRKARRKLDVDIETDAITAGRVGRGASVYVSARNLQRGDEQAARNKQSLLEMEAVNDLGQVYSIAELAEKSVSNPHIRHAELMVRLKGCEQLADRMGWVGRFITWTLPSRFHAVRARNQKWIDGDKPTPREGQNALRDLWVKVRAMLAKLKYRYFGVRVAEPHHDGTPHWHMLLFLPAAADAVCDLIRRYALLESPDEEGAAEHRFKVEVIDKAKGGATAYVAKYVSKHTTARGLEKHTDTGPDGKTADVCEAWDGAKRARRWASVHGIRQFQFVGLPPVGIYREMRRMDEPVPHDASLTARAWATLENARTAADAGDYALHVQAIGGAAVPRAAQRVGVWREVDATCTEYGDMRPAQTRGVRYQFSLVRYQFPLAHPESVLRINSRERSRRGMRKEKHVFVTAEQNTRRHVWTLRQRSGAALQGATDAQFPAPWTRVNNCNRGDRSGTESSAPDAPPVVVFSGAHEVDPCQHQQTRPSGA